MTRELLTIVIPTRNRPELLDKALRSVFENQDRVAKVVVSDNSTTELPALQALRDRYGFSYVRQSGELTMTEHHNACLQLSSTPWVLLLHDDDELCPNVLGKLEAGLATCGEAGVLVGGIHYISEDGTVKGSWQPDFGGTFKGEDIVLRLGLDFRVSPPGTVWNVAACRDLGGFPSANGVANEQWLVLRLAFSPGVVVLPELIGRYRIWSAQITNYSTPERAQHILDCTIEGAQGVRYIGISAAAADQLVDYMVWWVFRFVAPLFSQHPFFVAKMARKCEMATPANGAWRKRVKEESPHLFWKPRRLSILAYLIGLRLVPRPMRQAVKALPKHFVKLIRSAVGS